MCRYEYFIFPLLKKLRGTLYNFVKAPLTIISTTLINCLLGDVVWKFVRKTRFIFFIFILIVRHEPTSFNLLPSFTDYYKIKVYGLALLFFKINWPQY